MDITLKQQLLVQDIGAKYLMETNSSEPIPPKGLLVQCIDEACARIVTFCGRFLEPAVEQNSDDKMGMGNVYVFRFDMSERRAANKARTMAMLMHSYVVNASLAKIFASLNTTLANIHDTQSVADAQSINQLLRSKLPPI